MHRLALAIVCAAIVSNSTVAFGQNAPARDSVLRAVIITGHDRPNHDWRETSAALAEVLSQAGKMRARVESDPEFLAKPELHENQLVVLDYCNWQRRGLSNAAKENFLKFLQAGKGLLIVHFSCAAFNSTLPGAQDSDWPEFRKICRRWWVWGKNSHDPLGRFKVEIAADRPMLEGVRSFEIDDELYYGLAGDEPVRVLASARSKLTGREEPQVFLYNYGAARVFQTTLGHSGASIRTPGLTDILRRGSLWAAAGPTIVLNAEGEEKTLVRATLELWANRNMPVTGGLVAWFDATAEMEARRWMQLPELLYGHPLDVWHDASGFHRDLTQPNEASRPTMRNDIVAGSVRFDGRGSFISSDRMGLQFDGMTVFVVGTPLSNDGTFRAFVAMNQRGRDDFKTGLTIDQGLDTAKVFESLNIEGAGQTGARLFQFTPSEFGKFRRMCVTSTVGAGGTKLYMNGQGVAERDRAPSVAHMDQLTLGARFYGSGFAPTTQGFLSGEIAEVLVYDRVLSDPEREQVERYLAARYDNLAKAPPPATDAPKRPIAKIQNAPSVQMFSPGFTPRKMPVDLTNVNNVRYRADGKLFALTYDGRVLLLSDTNGDGLEDRVDTYWNQPGIVSPIGMALTPPNYARGSGVFIACKGAVLLIVDRDGDDRGDERIVVSEGWPAMKHRVDALGIAMAPDESVYFGLGTPAFANGYMLDEKGEAHYDPAGERGAILRVSPDFEKREIICSGIRFSVALAFNRFGDLFCTDQEGATWLPNGNPFDELLHIETDRHYGFPPRHPKHLPDVLDEPSVFDYTPQHQSACGLCFDERVGDNKLFGPEWWADSAMVTGYSRGKLWRTSLVKTDAGYVADNVVLGSVSKLPADVCISPRGDLVLATHGGGPDWGSGPGGKGTLYKIVYSDRECPQPVRAWAASPREVRIAFDRPIDPAQFKDLAKEVQIEYGRYVQPGDRFEVFHPGYLIVELQTQSPRALLPVETATIGEDGRSIVLKTAEHAQAVNYAVLMRAPERDESSRMLTGALLQLPVMELGYNLGGVDVQWQDDKSGAVEKFWLPHIDPNVARSLLAGSGEVDRLAEVMSKAGLLTLRTQLDLWRMLRPAVQLGATVDMPLPEEQVTVTLASATPFALRRGLEKKESKPTSEGRHRVELTVSPREGDWQPLEVTLVTGGASPSLSMTWHTAEDDRERAMAVRRFKLPWARWMADDSIGERPTPPELAGGDWHRGEEIFFSDKAQCGKCHQVRGRGGWIGPDLSNLQHRDYASVLRDITLPSFAINPDHLAYTVVTDDGRTLTGMVQTRGDTIVVGDIKGVETSIPRASVEEMKPTLLSIMPEGLPKVLGDDAMRDLLTYLLLKQPAALEPAPIKRAGAPPPRPKSEVDAVMKDEQPVDPSTLKPVEIVLCAGPKDHDIDEHDYPLWQERWSHLLQLSPSVRVTIAESWPSAEQWKTADCVVMFSANPAWSPERARELDAFQERGGGLVMLHYAINGQRAPEELASRVGLAWQGQRSKFRHGAVDLTFTSTTSSPITAGMAQGDFIDESYWDLVGDPRRITVLATQSEDGKPKPMLWTYQRGRGRVFVSILGHYTWTFDDPLFRLLVLRGMAWTMNQPTNRFNDLVLRGARVSER